MRDAFLKVVPEHFHGAARRELARSGVGGFRRRPFSSPDRQSQNHHHRQQKKERPTHCRLILRPRCNPRGSDPYPVSSEETAMRKLILSTMLLVASAAMGAELSETVDRTFDVKPGATVTLRNVNGG